MATSDNKEHLIVFQPSGRRGRFPVGTPVLDAARTLGVPIESVCGGRGICGKCQIEVAEGRFAKFGITSLAERLSPPGFIETRYEEKRGLAAGRRLSCSTQVLGDVVIDVPSGFVVTGQTIRKDANTLGMVRNPALRLCFVELTEPTLDDALGDAERLCGTVATEFGFDGVTMNFRLMSEIQTILRKSGWKVTAAVDVSGDQPEIVTLFSGYSEVLTGLAVDIGSTTIAAHLVDLMTGEILASSGRANPQIRFGEDLMSRVSFVMMNPGGRESLTRVVREAVNELIEELLEKSGAPRDALLEGVFVCNPVMHHLFLGFDPTELGQAPFAPVTSSSIRCAATDIGVDLGRGGRIYLLPIVAGHVGADAAAVVLAQSPVERPDRVLIVDVGTNAEILLWDGKKLFAASSPTGPAFEGAEISSGQRAAPGAIERIRIDRETLIPRYRVIGCEKWSDDEGFAEETLECGVTGICGSGIIEAVGEMLLAGILSPDGILRAPQTEAETDRLAANGRTWSYVLRASDPPITITQNDVRATQLAKSALYAGVKLLMDKAGIDAIDEVRLAGAFGSYIDPTYALLLGLVPDCAPEKVIAIGNAAGQGALKALLDFGARNQIEQTVREIEKVETALEKQFQFHFVNAMGLPNSLDPFELTREHFGLTARPATRDEGGQRRKRRQMRKT
jgi:uncharacterized 2Fe-2S/4Fe-4S cluster protein (DUF4445 family)